MCGRFAQAIPLGKLKKIDLFSDFGHSVTESYNVTPGENAGIIVYREKAQLVDSKWGFTGQYVKKGTTPKPIINARSESVAEKFTFKKSFQQYRCVIPVSGFYEWKVSGSVKESLFIYPENSEDDDPGLLFLAGIYQVTTGNQLLFAVITRGSAGILKEIHDRMPVGIPKDMLKYWLNPQTPAREVLNIMNVKYVSDFRFHQVSRAVNNPANKSKEFINPALTDIDHS